MRWMWMVLLFLGAAAIGFGVADDRPLVILLGALVVVGAGIGRDHVGPDARRARDRRPVAWPRLLLALAVLGALGVVLGAAGAPWWVALIIFAGLGALGCTRPVDAWIHGGRTA